MSNLEQDIRFNILPKYGCRLKGSTFDDDETLTEIEYRCGCGYEEEITIDSLYDRIKKHEKVCACCIISDQHFANFIDAYEFCYKKGCKMINEDPVKYKGINAPFEYLCKKCEKIHNTTINYFKKYGYYCDNI